MNITLEQIKSEQTKLAEMIAWFEEQQKARRAFYLPSFEVELRPGEHYAGIVLGKDGEPNYYLILLPGAAESIEWKDAKEWAAQQGGRLPTRREQSLLFANLKEEFKEAWYWSGEQHSNRSYAWFQDFRYGGQVSDFIGNTLRARAVRSIKCSNCGGTGKIAEPKGGE